MEPESLEFRQKRGNNSGYWDAAIGGNDLVQSSQVIPIALNL